MGYAMAKNIRKKMAAHVPLYLNDINRSACERFVNEFGSYGPVHIVDSAKDAATHAKILVSIVPGAADVRKAFLDRETGVTAAPEDPERLMLDCSTIDCQSSRAVGEELGAAGSGIFRDAPVSVCILSNSSSHEC
jgi:3-hydroxyisobutyrate/3-hydroxypropionate dehydrogenase